MSEASATAAPKTRVAVVGAGGYLGSALLEAAARRGADVIAVVRGAHSLPSVLRYPAEVVVTEGRADRLASSLKGVGAVIDVSVGKAPEIPLAAAELAQVCEAVGVPRVVYTSSAAAQPLRRRTLGRTRPGTYYGRQKARAESALARLMSTGHETVIVRPGLIWGPRSTWSIRHIDRLVSGDAFVPDAVIASSPHLAYGPNLADALLTLATEDGRQSGTFDYTDSWWSSWEQYFHSLATALEVGSQSSPRATRIRLGPFRALLLEAILQQPELARLGRRILDSSPPTLVGAVRSFVKAPSPPPTAVRDRGRLPADVQTTRMTQAERDIYALWSCPSAGAELYDHVAPPVGMADALMTTAAWARRAGFVWQSAESDGVG